MAEIFANWSIAGNLGIFAVAAGVVLFFGMKIENYAEAIAKRTGLSRVFAGMILLAIPTSLPEITTTVSATLRGNTDMAVHNLLGGVIFQTLILVVVDVVVGKNALTNFRPSFGLLIQAVVLIILLGMAAVAIGVDATWPERVSGDIVLYLIAVVYIGLQLFITQTSHKPQWTPSTDKDTDDAANKSAHDEEHQADGDQRQHTKSVYARLLGASGLILVAGWLIVVSSEAIAEQTGLGQSFIGFTLVSISTSLPEIGTTIVSARRGRPETSVANILGSNSFCVALLALIAVLSPDGVFTKTAHSATFAVGIGILLTALYLLGMLERRDRTFLRLGWDSVAVLTVGCAGIGAMYAFTRGG